MPEYSAATVTPGPHDIDYWPSGVISFGACLYTSISYPSATFSECLKEHLVNMSKTGRQLPTEWSALAHVYVSTLLLDGH